VAPPKLLADEMVGRLARYLRAVGCDTVYARGLPDTEIRELARREGRVLLTRDRELARRTPGAVRLESSALAAQWRALAARVPELPREIAFVRCTLCNGPLVPVAASEVSGPAREGVPWGRVEQGLALFRCVSCGHLYWEGSHTAQLRRAIRSWSEGSGP